MILVGACALLLAIVTFYRWLIYEAVPLAGPLGRVEEKHQLLDVEVKDVND